MRTVRDTIGVCYFLIGKDYAPLLLLSIYTLRRYYSGAIEVICDGQGKEEVEQFELPEVYPIDCLKDNKAKPFDVKPSIPLHFSFDRFVYLDSDTLIMGDISPIWPIEDEVVLTYRHLGKGTNVRMRNRIKIFRSIWPDRIKYMYDRSYPYPAINMGVHGGSKNLEKYYRDVIEVAASHESGTDEIATQITYPEYPHRILGRQFNAHVDFDRYTKGVKIWHGARGFWKKKENGRKLWRKELKSAKNCNFGNINRYEEFEL